MKLELSEVNSYQCIILEVPDVLQIHFRRNSEPLGHGWPSEGALGSSSTGLCTVQVTALGVLSAPCTRRRTPVAFRRSSSVEVLLEDRSESGGSDGKIV